jgi:hypothetical protein
MSNNQNNIKMKIRRFAIVSVTLLIASVSFGQKIKVTEGKISALADVKTIKIVYDYSNLGVGKFDVEDEYIEKKVADMNEDEAGTGDAWKEAWFGDRQKTYEPKFEDLFAKYASSIKSGPDVESDVTMLVHTTFIEPGFNVGVAKKPALINLEITFHNEGSGLLKVLVLKSPGTGAGGFDYDAEYRISEAYAKAGKTLGKYLEKNLN